MEANGKVLPHTSLLIFLSSAASSAGSPQPFLVPHILLVETHHHLCLITGNSERILHKVQNNDVTQCIFGVLTIYVSTRRICLIVMCYHLSI